MRKFENLKTLSQGREVLGLVSKARIWREHAPETFRKVLLLAAAWEQVYCGWQGQFGNARASVEKPHWVKRNKVEEREWKPIYPDGWLLYSLYHLKPGAEDSPVQDFHSWRVFIREGLDFEKTHKPATDEARRSRADQPTATSLAVQATKTAFHHQKMVDGQRKDSEDKLEAVNDNQLEDRNGNALDDRQHVRMADAPAALSPSSTDLSSVPSDL